MDNFLRTALLLGSAGMDKLKKSKVAIFGIGGVGSYVCESLIRSGVENFILVDNDTISVTNINRQIHANVNTVGLYKVDVMKERMLSINPYASIITYKDFFLPGNESNIIDESVNYIVDAIDTVTAKIELVKIADKLNIPIISSMGTGNKLNPTMLEVSDIYNTSVCPLAKVMRDELKKLDIKKLKVVYSKEKALEIDEKIEKIANEKDKTSKRRIIGSVSFVPSVAGLIISSEVVKDIINEIGNEKETKNEQE